MEGLAPPLKLLLEVKKCIECGETAKAGVQAFLQSDQSDFAQEVRSWLLRIELGRPDPCAVEHLSVARRVLLTLLERTFAGQSILGPLKDLEQEMIQMSKIEIDTHLAKLPFLLLLPLVFCQFPAFLLLLFGPVLGHLLASLAGGG